MTDAERIVRALHLWSTHPADWKHEPKPVRDAARYIKSAYEEHKRAGMSFPDAAENAKIRFVENVLNVRDALLIREERERKP